MFKIMKYEFPREANSTRLSPPDDSGVWEISRIDTHVVGSNIWAAVIWKVKEKTP